MFATIRSVTILLDGLRVEPTVNITRSMAQYNPINGAIAPLIGGELLADIAERRRSRP
jgi:hypothetical protein